MNKLTEELKKAQFEQDLNHSATVERHNLKDLDGVLDANTSLLEVGQALKKIEPSLKEAVYTGSIAVHYYHMPNTQQPIFLSQASTIAETPEVFVQAGITDLRNQLLKQFGHSGQHKRSGF